jgi:hypothetical protein
VLPLLFPTIGIMAVCAPLCADHFAGLGMQTWRWLAATPIDRDRAFRILFGPALAFVVVVVGARFAMTEASDRSVFFRDGRRPGFEDVGAKTVTLASLLETGPSGYGYRPADASKLAVALSGRLRDTFGLTIPPARIEADFRRGWPEHPTPGRTEDHMSYVLDGLERVRLDLGDEIASADRRIDAAIAVGMVLMFLVLLRTGFRDRVLRTVTVILVGTPLAMNGILHREFPRYREATDELFGAIFGSPHAAQWTLVAASCVVGWLLWRSSMNAFRRIDLADIPPNPLGGRSPPRD